MARPSKYTPEVLARLEQAIALGATYALAAGYAGISPDCLSRWLATKAGFADIIKAAEARGALGWLAKIEKAANDDNWQAAAWKLERRYPRDYGRIVQTHEVSGPEGREVVFRVVRD